MCSNPFPVFLEIYHTHGSESVRARSLTFCSNMTRFHHHADPAQMFDLRVEFAHFKLRRIMFCLHAMIFFSVYVKRVLNVTK